jgi:hypothetical protein
MHIIIILLKILLPCFSFPDLEPELAEEAREEL